jgi:outer membrane protein assembly factor BamB
LATLVAALLVTGDATAEQAAPPIPAVAAEQAAPPSHAVAAFHGDRQRLGWSSRETALSPTSVAGPAFGPVWSSPPLDAVVLDGVSYTPHLYASPVFVEDAALSDGVRTSLVIAATSNGFVYAIAADADAAPGTILWRQQLGKPGLNRHLDGGIPMGILSTPIVDLEAQPPRLYAVAADVVRGWQAFALDLGSGDIINGWPVQIDDRAVQAVNQNGPARLQPADVMSQRGALNLSPDGGLLYVPFGSYVDGGAGWLVAIDTQHAVVDSAFSVAPSREAVANGGIWSAGGPAVDTIGRVYATTGNSPAGSADAPRVWGQSLLELDPHLRLLGAYTPFNYCALDSGDIDLGGSSPLVMPELDAATTETPRLIAFGGKQGTVYLLDRDALGVSSDDDHRPPCTTDSTADRSLHPPDPQPQYSARGPLNVFGPYSERYGQGDWAKMRTTPAYFREADGSSILFVSGTTRAAEDSIQAVPPGVARLRVVTSPGQAAYLAVEGSAEEAAFLSPGSPVITSNGAADAIVWVLDANVRRSQPLIGPDVPHPVLYAFDAASLQLLWRSTPDQLEVGGKYNTPVIAHGIVYVGTDRVQAFGLVSSSSALLEKRVFWQSRAQLEKRVFLW